MYNKGTNQGTSHVRLLVLSPLVGFLCPLLYSFGTMEKVLHICKQKRQKATADTLRNNKFSSTRHTNLCVVAWRKKVKEKVPRQKLLRDLLWLVNGAYYTIGEGERMIDYVWGGKADEEDEDNWPDDRRIVASKGSETGYCRRWKWDWSETDQHLLNNDHTYNYLICRQEIILQRSFWTLTALCI